MGEPIHLYVIMKVTFKQPVPKRRRVEEDIAGNEIQGKQTEEVYISVGKHLYQYYLQEKLFRTIRRVKTILKQFVDIFKCNRGKLSMEASSTTRLFSEFGRNTKFVKFMSFFGIHVEQYENSDEYDCKTTINIVGNKLTYAIKIGDQKFEKTVYNHNIFAFFNSTEGSLYNPANVYDILMDFCSICFELNFDVNIQVVSPDTIVSDFIKQYVKVAGDRGFDTNVLLNWSSLDFAKCIRTRRIRHKFEKVELTRFLIDYVEDGYYYCKLRRSYYEYEFEFSEDDMATLMKLPCVRMQILLTDQKRDQKNPYIYRTV